MRVHAVYAHPSSESFTRAVLDAFTGGAREAGHSVTISDLYAMEFHPVLSAAEYGRESSYAAEMPVAPDVAAEQAALEAAEVWVFVYPVWWTDCPAILKGWFDRVWSAGWAYAAREPHRVRQALVLCTAGHTRETLNGNGQYQAMETVMLTDRIAGRADIKTFHVFGGSHALPAEQWTLARAAHLQQARELGAHLGS